jgi:hypothetical protein
MPARTQVTMTRMEKWAAPVKSQRRNLSWRYRFEVPHHGNVLCVAEVIALSLGEEFGLLHRDCGPPWQDLGTNSLQRFPVKLWLAPHEPQHKLLESCVSRGGGF